MVSAVLRGAAGAPLFDEGDVGSPTLNRIAPHGTERGFAAGCRSRGGCVHRDSRLFLTCAEAVLARRSDYQASRLPADQPVPRAQPEPARAEPVREDAPRRVQAQERSREPKGISHGTTTGYLKGCRGADCPGASDGRTCNEARNLSRRRRARELGVPDRPESVDAAPAERRISELRAAGLTLRRISSVTKVGRTTIANISNGTTVKIWPATLSAILAVEAHHAA